MVLLNQPTFPEAQAVADRLEARCGERYHLTWAESTAGQGVAVQRYQLNGQQLDLALMPVPIPWSELEGPCATNRFWPEAAAVCQEHSAHLIASLSGDWGDPIRRHLALTDFVAALVEATGAVAVYWGGGGVVQSAAQFGQWAAGGRPDDLPLLLWVNFQLFAHEGAPFVATTGLGAFGLMEIEGGSQRLKPIDLVGKIYDIAHYTCTRGPVLQDGETIGESAAERIKIRHTESVMGRPHPVIRLEFDGADRPRGLLARLFGR